MVRCDCDDQDEDKKYMARSSGFVVFCLDAVWTGDVHKYIRSCKKIFRGSFSRKFSQPVQAFTPPCV